MSPREEAQFVQDSIRESGRAIIITPSWYQLERATSELVPTTAKVMVVRDIEEGLEAFMADDRAVLALANRYDGIDMPDEACRLIVLAGLPSGTHLQERFLYERLGARQILAERLRTRIQQGAGRCTRNAQDWAAVIAVGQRLTDFCGRRENILSLRPELQAEIDFGFDNSERADALIELLRAFRAQDDDWKVAENDIRRRTREAAPEEPRDSEVMERSAGLEVEAWHSVWVGDHARAVELAQEAADTLGHGELRPYRALWLYLAASWAETLGGAGSAEHARLAETLKREAIDCARVLAWTPAWHGSAHESTTGSEFNLRASQITERMLRLGVRGTKFELAMAELEERLDADDATPFELGLEQLGSLLGFESVRSTAKAAPDCAWRDGSSLWLVFEAKTEEAAAGELPVSDIRQANTHRDWVAGQLGWDPPEQSLTSIITYRTSVDPDARALANDDVYTARSGRDPGPWKTP